MVRRLFFIFTILSLVGVTLTYFIWPPILFSLIVILPLIGLGFYDVTHTHNILRNYPVIGHLRYMFEFIRPEIQQYFVATNLSGEPFNREIRSLVYQRAKGVEDTHPFGTEHNVQSTNYEYAEHSMAVKKLSPEMGRISVGGPQCRSPYLASRINISAMSFGAISRNAVMAMNLGAKLGNFFQDTGEGGLTEYHLKHGGDIVWEIGTGYFGCRTLDGDFDEEKFRQKAMLDVVKMIEIKISQGAKPSHGGVLPAVKIDKEIAEIRGIAMGEDCISPPTHKTFSTPKGLCAFIQRLRELSNGKPVGFKLCIGKKSEFMGICKAMLETGIYPDFITVDGAEGGTGAAPLEFSNYLGTPINEALAFVHNCLVGINLRQHIRIIASGKVATGFDVVMKIALGANMINMARGMMFAVGCIQAMRCNTNNCPTGVTTQDRTRGNAIVVDEKGIRVRNFHHATMKSFLSITGAMGVENPDKLSPDMIYHRRHAGKSEKFTQLYHYVEAGNFLGDEIHPFYKNDWKMASADAF